MPATRTAERTEFLRDVITGALEGGIGYWSQCSQYQWVADDERVMVVVGERVGDDARAVVHRLKDDESGYESEPLVIDVDVVAKGIGIVTKPEFGLNTEMKKNIMLASQENDAGYMDALDCDAVVQAGLLGDVVFG